jgi:hypothetical protein
MFNGHLGIGNGHRERCNLPPWQFAKLPATCSRREQIQSPPEDRVGGNLGYMLHNLI